jgi:hypothetical protein
MKLGTHMPGGERFRSDISFLRYRAETKKKYLIFVLFLEVVTLTFVLQTSLSIGFLLSPSAVIGKGRGNGLFEGSK